MGVRILYSLFHFKPVRRLCVFKNWNCSFGESFVPNFISIRSMGSQLSPPTTVRGMKHLQKELFDKNVSVPCLIVPVASIVQVKLILKPYFLKIPNFKPLQEIPVKSDCETSNIVYTDRLSTLPNLSKIAILDPRKVSTFDDISVEHRDVLSKCSIQRDSFIFLQMVIGYNNWNADEILRAVIPEELESVSSYSLCGHIVHLNLRDHLVEYKRVIGDVLLGKVPQARTVVNKIDNIDSTFRTFSMEILSGENEMITDVKENKCKYIFDFSKVYWNSRLSTEHERIVNSIKKGDVLYDVFCGVGPFSIPASKKGCRVLANDLNPESIKWLKESSKLNKTSFKICNKDGNKFIVEDVKDDLLKMDSDFKGTIHIVMNLPGMAVEFLPSFRNLFDRDEIEAVSKLPTPIVYVYCFTKGEDDPAMAARKLAECKLDYDLTNDLIGVNFVRNVAPMKEMMRVSFKLSPALLSGRNKRAGDFETNSTSAKKICADSTKDLSKQDIVQ